MAKRPRCENVLQGLDAEQIGDVREQMLSSLQAMQRKAAQISKALQPTVTDDSRTSSWWSYAEKRLSEFQRKQCAKMSVDLYEDIDNIIRSISPKRNVTQNHPSILANEVLADVFMLLGRLSLDAVQLTCRRFNGIVADHIKDYCLRPFDYVCIMNLHPTEEGVYRLAIETDLAELNKSPSAPFARDYRYESKNVHKLISIMRAKLPNECFISWLDFSGLTEKLPALGMKAIGALGGVYLGCLTVSDTGIRTPWPHAYLEISAADLMPLLDSFAAVRKLKLQGVTLTSARNDFLDFCRKRGILSVLTDYGATVDGDISVNAVMRFCFGPVSKDLEGEKRKLRGFSDFHESVVNRVYKAARSKPRHVVKLSLRVGGNGNDELRPLLDSKYQWDSEKMRYFRTLDNGVTLHWWFNEEKGRIDCKLIPYPREPLDEADKNKAAKD